jgi:hypothetical protein
MRSNTIIILKARCLRTIAGNLLSTASIGFTRAPEISVHFWNPPLIGQADTPAVVMDSGLADAALRASHAPRNDDWC